ncbi:tetratricopeptide repeat protein (macronuclear) [Tetrahymena thermophila SB210]|uniref:Tetratricopeptide repeat protein n=1 Tax=Tetrahymena thermophila (strain SB210) TaxID=312017 RepID=Q24C57_TETTS|nr:tetratricopeptide repeat protein [Tetrahymena thermophila SB210]EAS05381.2 tetratricopeptide repeat protein [Tetrahymena thermophila SB210]|eukprot:XP_001025626.2 tetratricopeptide repeat protein [Tetrahymena thermophila SB210]
MKQQLNTDKNLVQEVKNLYYNSKLDECIHLVDESSNIQQIQEYLIANLYKSICFFEHGQYKNGFQSFEQLIITLKEANKTNQYDEIEVLIRSFYQWQIFFYNADEAVKHNLEFKKILDSYQQLYQHQQIYNEGVYFFGLGTFEMIEMYDLEELSLATDLLIKAKQLLNEYEQDLIPLISWTYYLSGKNNQSLECINELFAINPNFPQILNYIAIYCNRLQKLDEAEKYYLLIVEQSPKNTIFLNNIAQFYYCQDKKDLALQYVQKSYEIDKENSYSSTLYGQILTDLGDLKKAQEILVQGIEYNPQYADLFSQLAKVEQKLQNEEGFLKNLERCIQINPQESFYYLQLGIGQSTCGLNTQALTTLSKCLELKQSIKHKHYTYSWLGFTYLSKFEMDQALQNFLKCLDLNLPPQIQETEIQTVNYLLDQKELSLNFKTQQINQMQNYFFEKLSVLIENMQKSYIQVFLKKKLIEYSQLLSLICYKQQLQDQLNFQSGIQHWDLFID